MDKPLTQTEPVRMAAAIRSLILISATLGYFGLSRADAELLGANAEILLTVALPALIAIVEWVSAHWVRGKVSSPETAETLANAVKAVDKARGQGAPVKVPLSALRAAERVLSEPEHPVRWMHDGTP